MRGVREPLQWRGVWRTGAPGGKAGNSHGAESAQHGKHALSGAIVVKHCGQALRSSTALKHRKARAESMPLYLVLFFLDTTSTPKQNSLNYFVRIFRGRCIGLRTTGEFVRYLPGWTVQCINPDCAARGHWLRADAASTDHCSNCGELVRNVSPPLGPRLRMRPRSLGGYRPRMRPR